MFTESSNSSMVCCLSSFAISDSLLLDGPRDDRLDSGVERLQQGLAVLVVLLVVADGLYVVLGEPLYLLPYLPDAEVVVVLEGHLGVLAGLLRLVGVGDVLPALLRALALLLLRLLLLLLAHGLPGLFREVALRLAVLSGVGVALLGLPLLLGPVLEVLLGLVLLALVAASLLLVLLGEELGLAGAPLALLAALVRGLDLLLDLLPKIRVRVLS